VMLDPFYLDGTRLKSSAPSLSLTGSWQISPWKFFTVSPLLKKMSKK